MSTPESFFKGYWLVTNRCNLDCGYCVLEDAPEQLRRELGLEEKKAFLSHLYERLGFQREGVKRRGRKLDGAYDDNILMALLLAPTESTPVP